MCLVLFDSKITSVAKTTILSAASIDFVVFSFSLWLSALLLLYENRLKSSQVQMTIK